MSRLAPDLPEDAGIDTYELSVLLGVDEGEAVEILLAEIGDGLDVRYRTNPETGEDERHLGDVEAICERRRRDPRSFKTRRSLDSEREPLPPSAEVAGFTFSDDGGSTGRTPSANDGVHVAEAARQAGISEDDLRERLIGKCRLRVVDGELVARRGDLQRLAASGSIPSPSKADAERATAAAIGTDSASTDPAVEARTRRAAEAIGAARPEPTDIDRRADAVAATIGVERERSSMATETKPEPPQAAGVQRITADDRTSHRIGQPRRWGQS